MKKYLTAFLSLIACHTTPTFGTTIHTANILIHDRTIVYAWLHIGTLENGQCHWHYILQPTPKLTLQPGDSVNVDSDEIEKRIGIGFNCATLNFQINDDHPIVRDYFTLLTENNHYITTTPSNSIVTLL